MKLGVQAGVRILGVLPLRVCLGGYRFGALDLGF